MSSKKQITPSSEHDMPPARAVVPRSISEEMRQSYLNYAMTVITARALPDVRDGLKPVHRRILYTMHKMGLHAGAKFRKSAAVTGDVLGKFHPHGDMAVYDAMVKMAQDFTMRYPLIWGQGNWGSLDGDNAAAMRYCVTGDTLIPTAQGLIPINEIGARATKGEDIDERILSLGKRVSPARKWFDSGVHPTIRVTTARGYTIQGSHNHPLLVWSADPLTGMPHYAWKLLGNITPGDIAVIDRTASLLWPATPLSLRAYQIDHASRAEKKILPETLSPDLGFILGALISEGTLKDHKIEFCNTDPEFLALFAEAWKRVFPDCRLHVFNKKANGYGKKPYVVYEIHARAVIHFLKAMGLEPQKSAHRKIPHTILRSSQPVVSAFLRGYFEGDGTVTFSGKMNELSAISKSKTLLAGIQIILLRFGIVTALRFDTRRGTYKLYIRGLDAYTLFSETIGFACSRKQKKLATLITRLSKRASQTDYVPYLRTFVRSHLQRTYGSYLGYMERHNFDRYDTLAKEQDTMVHTVTSEVRTAVSDLTSSLLSDHYFFDPIVEATDAGDAPVFSLRVESDCHSFVGNGFINHNTECKMTRLSGSLLGDIEKETVDWRPNYDGTQKEPVVLPAAFPNLLANGTLGIAVGMATNIPPHNLSEILDACITLVEKPETSQEELFASVRAPDFPTGGVIYNEKEIRHAYATGKGPMVVRGEAEIVEDKKGAFSILITSIPYRVNKAELIKKMAELVQEKKVEGIRDIRDESTKDVRIVVDLKSGAQPEKVLNYLYKHTPLEDTFHLNMVALVDGVPRTLSLKGMLESFLVHKRDVVRKRTEFDLKAAEARAHILEGLVKALDHIDAIIKTIKAAKDVPTAHADLMKKFTFSDVQASAILEMKLQKLAGLERKKLEDELKEVRALIKELEEILHSPKKMAALIKSELLFVKEKFGDDRRTKVVRGGIKAFNAEDLIPDEENVLVLTKGGYIKRTNPDEYKRQKRGGVGVVDLNTKEEDVVTHLLGASTHDDLLFFTNRGKAYQIKMYDVPEGKRATRGKSIMNVLALASDESVTSVVRVPKGGGAGKSFMLVTEGAIAKKVAADAFSDVRRSGIIAITLKNDSLVSAQLVEKGDSAFLVTARGQSIRFKESDIREMGRAAGGVRAMRLGKGDRIISMNIASAKTGGVLLVLSEQGFGKKTPLKEFKIQKRGGSGIKAAAVTAKTGPLIGASVLPEGDEAPEEMVVVSQKGQVIRTGLNEVSTSGRATQGVRVMKLRAGDQVASLVCL